MKFEIANLDRLEFRPVSSYEGVYIAALPALDTVSSKVQIQELISSDTACSER